MGGGSSSLVRQQLEAARQSWLLGDWFEARMGAQKALSSAVACRDGHLEAGASLLLAQVLALQSSFAWARRFGTRAHELFAERHDPVGLSDSVLCMSQVDGALGQHAAAMRHADTAIAGLDGSARRSAAGLNYRGVVAGWTGQYGAARRALEAACEQAPAEAGSPAAVFHPQSNAMFNEVLRCARMRMEGHRVDLSELAVLVGRQRHLVQAGETGCLTQTSADPGLFLLEFASCFLATRSGDAARADAHYLACLQRAVRLPETSWMQSLLWWARLERTLAAGEAQQAAVSAARLVAVAEAGEHVPLKALARGLGAEARQHIGRAFA